MGCKVNLFKWKFKERVKSAVKQDACEREQNGRVLRLCFQEGHPPGRNGSQQEGGGHLESL